MARIKLNKSGFTTCPTLILQNRRFQNLGNISKPCDLTYKENLNSANELSFTVFKKMNDNILYIWDKILCNKVLYSPELNERFIIQTPISEDKSVFKQVTAKSLCESELSQIVLYNVEINTETDILRDNYVKTTFYNPDNPKASILNRILDKAPHYSIGYVQPSLINIEKVSQFSFNDKDIYSALTDDIAKEFNCIFIFDSMTRTISAYDLYNTCEDCGFRGDFNNECPECGSKNFSGKYGKDTTIFISNENLATDINLEPEFDQLKNCMYVEGGDDIINAAIRSINPNGSNYIYYFNNETKDDMSSLLRKYLEGYDIQYNIYNNTHTYYLSINSVAFYNEIVQYIYDRFGEDSDFGESINKLPTNGDLIGYPSTTNAMYNSINLYYILKTSMMPTIDTEGQGIEDSLKAITDGFSSGFVSKDTDTPFTNMIAVRDIAKATKSDIERAIEKTARIFYSPAYYDLKVHTLSYSIGTWIGTIELESLTETDENGEKIGLISSTITLAVIESNELYTQQEIYRAIANKDKLGKNQICSLKLSDEAFKDKITYYSLDELNHIQDMFNSCNDVLVRTDEACNMDDALLNKYKEFCTNRISFVISEKETRNDQIEQVKEIYFNGDSESQPCGELYDTRNGVNKKLNFEAYIKSAEDGEQLWNEFCSYRREDKYSNSNYISDGKTDSEIIEHATKLMDVAKKEMYKAGTMQYSLTATINNLLAIPEFEPLVDAFEVGNWIRVRINGVIYQLRLLSYTTDFSDLNKLSVEFSTVEKIFTGFSDVQSVLNSTASMVSSYPGLVQQVDVTTSTTARVNNWVEKGLNATLTKYVDSDNEEIVVDNHGILGRHYDYITNTYDPYQLKVLSNGLYTTHDGWNTIDAGVGRFTYYDPELDKWVDDYGIIAKTVVGKLIMGEKLKIYGANNSIILDDNGITLDGGAIKWKSKLPTSSVDGLDDTVKDFVDAIGDLQGQIDGEITSWFEEYNPTTTNEPASLWITDTDKIKHEGDLFYNTATGAAYRYIYNSSTKQHEWSVITDTAITEALANAAKAQDTADGKRRVFTTTPTPPYDIGDLWSQGSNGDIMVCVGTKLDGQNYSASDWSKASKYTDDTAWKAWTSDSGEFGQYKSKIQTQIDGKSNCTYGGSTPPSNPETGDLWFCTNSSSGYGANKSYMYNGSSWVESNGVPDSVWDIADGKSSIFVVKPNKALSSVDSNFYHKNDIWILESDMTLNGKLYKKGSIMTSTSDSTSFVESHWVEKVRYTDDTTAKETNKKVSNFQQNVNKLLNADLPLNEIGDDYIFSPYIGGGYLYIKNPNDERSVTIDPQQTYSSNGYILKVTDKNGNTTIGADSDGNATFCGELKVKSIDLSSCINKISTNNISGLSTVATSGNYTDLGNKPDLTVYATNTSVNDALKNYAKNGDLEAYLKTNDLSAKLNGLNVAYNGDVITTQSIDSSTGLITTTNRYKDSSGVYHEYTTYTYKDSDYVLLNRTNQWGSGDTLVKIEKDGLLTAKNAIIYGTIYATSGEFGGELKSATGSFSGELKCGGAGNINPNRYQYELTDDGLHMGLSDGDTRWMFNIEKDGAIFSYGSFAFGENKFQYNSAQNTLWLYSNDTARSLSLVPNNCAIVSNDQIVLKNSTRTIGLYTKKEDSTCAFRPQNSDTGNISLGTSAAKWKDVWASTGTIQPSDRNKKKNINILENKYVEFFKRLLPVSYQFKNGTSGRTHIGFISQDVEQAMFEVGLTDLDFAGFCKDIKQEFYLDENGNECSKNVYDEDGNPVYEYSLRYDEFIALNTHMIQSCLNKLETLESRIEKLEKAMAK